MTAEPRCWGGGGVSHPSQLTTGLVIKSVTTSPTLAGERMLFILQVSILSEQMHCTKKIFRQKLLQISIRNFWCKNVFDRPMGVASSLIAQFGFLVTCLKNALYKIFLPDKSCYKSKFATFMLCNIFLYLT